MSKLEKHFMEQPLTWINCKLDSMRENIHPNCLADFDDYRRRLLWIIEDPSNACVISDTSVLNVINQWNHKIGKAFSWHTYSLQVEKAVTEAANNTSWEQAA